MAKETERTELRELAVALSDQLDDPRAMRRMREASQKVFRGLLQDDAACVAWERGRKLAISIALADPTLRDPDNRPTDADGWELEAYHDDYRPVKLENGELENRGLGLVRLWVPPEYLKRNKPSKRYLLPGLGDRDWSAKPLSEDEQLTIAGIIHDAHFDGTGTRLVNPWIADKTIDTDPYPLYSAQHAKGRMQDYLSRDELMKRWEAEVKDILADESPHSRDGWGTIRKAGKRAVAYLESLTRPPVVPEVPLPEQPAPVQSAIDKLSRVIRKAQCVQAHIEEGIRWGWDQREPSPPQPLPTLYEHLAAEQSRIEDAGVQTWNETLKQQSCAGWENRQEFHDELLRHREGYATWQRTIMQYWADLMGAIPEAQSAIKATKPLLHAAVGHPGEWITEALRSLRYLAALRESWGELPWIGDPEDLRGPIADLLQRMDLLQAGDFAVQPNLGDNPESNTGDDGVSKTPKNKPGGYTAKELRDETETVDASVSPTTFTRIRKVAQVAGPPKGTAGQNWKYSNNAIQKLSLAARDGGLLGERHTIFRNGKAISRAWLALTDKETETK